MEISGDYVFDAPQEIVWKALQDPNVLGAVMPGGQKFEQVGEKQYAGALLIKVGPVQGTFQGEIKLSNINPPESYEIAVDGKGAPGFVKASGSLRLEPRNSQTYMQYSGQAQIGGRIASVGQRLLDTSARSIIRQSLEALNEYLKVQVAQQGVALASDVSTAGNTAITPPSVTSLEYKPPSQMALVFRVARDVFNEIVPARYQWLLAGSVIAVIVIIIWLILK
jgi:carbon monoxide dehydrogenase subunit G